MGFMGRTHVAALAALTSGEAVLAGYADTSTGAAPAFEGNLSVPLAGIVESVARYTDAGAMFQSGALDAAVIATPTDTHADLAVLALGAGLHVLIEKPIALTTPEIGRIERAAQMAARLAIPAMVMRFWPGWPYLADCVRDERFGMLRSLRFTRLGSRPAWSGFYADEARCGGALHDLHIHDVDFVHHLLGRPSKVLSIGSASHVLTAYRFGKGAPGIVIAEGGWLPSDGRGFRMRYSAEFQDATVEFDLGRAPTVTVTRGGQAEHPQVPQEGPYTLQMRAFAAEIRATEGGLPSAGTGMKEGIAVTRVLEAERRSLRTGDWEQVAVDEE